MKTELENISHNSRTIALSKGTFLDKKTLIFCKKMLTSAKFKGSRNSKGHFLKLHKGVYLRAKFNFSSIILTSFRQGVILPLPPQNELLKKPPRLGLMQISKIYFEM